MEALTTLYPDMHKDDHSALYVLYLNEDWTVLQDSTDSRYRLTLTPKADGSMKTVHITAADINGTDIYELTVERFIIGEVPYE